LNKDGRLIARASVLKAEVPVSTSYHACQVLKMLVGAEGFEPPTLCSQSRFYCSLKLVEIGRNSVLLIGLSTAYLPIPVDPCGFWVL
jgi:hypothetical protein